MILFGFSACVNSDDGKKLEYGFAVTGSDPPSDGSHCGFKADSDKFDINDVTLDFYFGASYISGILENGERFMSYPEFDIYFCDENFKLTHLIRHVEENYISSEYIAKFEPGSGKKEPRIVYNHHENITIPSHLFVGDKGMLGFRVGGVNVASADLSYHDFNGVWIYYKVDGNTVTLSGNQF